MLLLLLVLPKPNLSLFLLSIFKFPSSLFPKSNSKLSTCSSVLVPYIPFLCFDVNIVFPYFFFYFILFCSHSLNLIKTLPLPLFLLLHFTLHLYPSLFSILAQLSVILCYFIYTSLYIFCMAKRNLEVLFILHIFQIIPVQIKLKNILEPINEYRILYLHLNN